MINSLKSLFKRNTPPLPYCPPGTRIYCIGDIHGRDDLLQQLHEKILQDVANYKGHKTLIYLGDYIDRGERSKQLIELLLAHPLPGFELIYLRGNHEQTLLDFLIEAQVGRSWFNFGGLQTLVSYGVKPGKLATTTQDLKDLQTALRERISPAHIHFLEQTQSHYVAGSYYFVHAGVSPRFDLNHQHAEDQLWIRNAFIEHRKPFEKIIVHGHTISDEPDFKPNRIGLDTGAYLSGKLSCLVLQDDQQRIIQTHA